MIRSKIKSFRFEENLLDSTKETELKTKIPTILNLSLSRKGASYVLIHSIPISLSTPKERQYSIINALAPNNPFPLSNPMNNKIRIWLKTGKHSKGESIVGGENWLLLEKLLNPPSGSTISEDGEEREEGIIKDTGIKIEIGLNSYPLVEILLNEDELAKCCNGCGDFESCKKDSERFKRCNRCKQAYYVCFFPFPYLLPLFFQFALLVS